MQSNSTQRIAVHNRSSAFKVARQNAMIKYAVRCAQLASTVLASSRCLQCTLRAWHRAGRVCTQGACAAAREHLSSDGRVSLHVSPVVAGSSFSEPRHTNARMVSRTNGSSIFVVTPTGMKPGTSTGPAQHTLSRVCVKKLEA